MVERGRVDLRRACRVAALGMLVIVIGCTNPDPEHIQSRRDYQALVKRKPPEAAVAEAPPPIPELQPLVAAPPPPGI